jgi:hypothetical protein
MIYTYVDAVQMSCALCIENVMMLQTNAVGKYMSTRISNVHFSVIYSYRNRLDVKNSTDETYSSKQSIDRVISVNMYADVAVRLSQAMRIFVDMNVILVYFVMLCE